MPVTVMTLDGWRARCAPLLRRVDLWWMDVQGAEARVLRGGTDTLRKTRILKLECHRGEMYAGQATEEELLGMLSGWTCLGRYGDDLLLRNDALEDLR